MASITRRRSERTGKVAWIAQVSAVGKGRVTRSFATKVEAKEWSAETESQARAGTITIARRWTLSQLIDKAQPHLAVTHSAAALAYWRAELGGLRLNRISPRLIAQHCEHLLGAPCHGYKHKTDKPRCPQTVANWLQVLSRVYSIGQRKLHLVDVNPVAQVERPATSKGRKRFLSDDERQTLLDACRTSESRWLRAFVLLLLTTGARRGEAYGLAWANVDFDAKWAVFIRTKNGESRGVPLTDAVIDALRALPREGEQVFPHDQSKAWATAVKRAKLVDFHMHDLRHSAASALVQNGATLVEVSTLLGHKDPRMSFRYAHLANANTTRLVERVMSDIR